MCAWRGPAGVLDIWLEDISKNFANAMAKVFRYLDPTEIERELGYRIAAEEDIQRMDHAAIAANLHIYSRTLLKRRDKLPETIVQRFEKQYGDLIQGLGYVLSISAV